MEIPLRLKELRSGALTYGIPLWYRVGVGSLLAVVCAALVMDGSMPGLAAWIVVLLLALGALYEERWDIDPKARTVTHRAWLVVAPRRTAVAFDDISSFTLSALARGTIPGGEEERKASAMAFAQMRGESDGTERAGFLTRHLRRRDVLNLILHTTEGQDYLIDSLPARKASRLKRVGDRFAAACGRPFSEELPD